MENIEGKEEQILIRITGQDRPGLTAAVMGILARYNARIFQFKTRFLWPKLQQIRLC